ncbi:GNAT family N-acetyltransferase [Alphaproteobacteria bacterium]|nr:GNAT family N-acetyltransferase [Alphaproteobacteria bacterium]
MLAVRKVSEKDSKVIFDWRNDNLTRKMSRNSELVEYEVHCKWFAATLKNANRCLLMCELKEGEPIGIVRFDVEGQSAELSINLSPLERGKRLAPKCLALAKDYFEKQYPSVSKLIAEIKTSNIASKKSFEKVGFMLDREKDSFWYYSVSINI